MNRLIKILANSRFLKGDIGYHLVRASMVIIFVLFGYQKWFEYEAQDADPVHQKRPADFLVVLGLRHPGSELFPRGIRVADCRAPDVGLLE